MSRSKGIDTGRSIIRSPIAIARPTTSMRRRYRRRRRRWLSPTVSFFPPCSFFRSRGLDVAWEPMNGARPCVTSLAALVHMEGVPGVVRARGRRKSGWLGGR